VLESKCVIEAWTLDVETEPVPLLRRVQTPATEMAASTTKWEVA
jgi:hypothetical protein